MSEVSNQYQTVISREAPEVEAYKLALMEQARILSGSPPSSLPQYNVAGPSSAHTQAYDTMMGTAGTYGKYAQGAIDLGRQGIAGLNTIPNIMNRMGGAFNSAGTSVNQGIAGLGAASQQGQNVAGTTTQGIGNLFGQVFPGLQNGGQMFDPNSVGAFMNPYENEVVQRTMQDIQKQGDIQGNALDANAVAAGAFGGSRHGIVEAEHGRNVLDAQAQAAGALRHGGYTNAMGQAMGAFEAGKGRQIQSLLGLGQMGIAGLGLGAQTGMQAADMSARNAQGIGSLGLGYGGLAGSLAGVAGGMANDTARTWQGMGTSYAGIGELLQNMNLRDTQGLMGVGDMSRGITNQQYDATRMNQAQSVYEPYQRLGFYSDILRGAPTSSMQMVSGTTNQQAQQPSMWNQLAGAATTAVGLAGAGKTLGLI